MKLRQTSLGSQRQNIIRLINNMRVRKINLDTLSNDQLSEVAKTINKGGLVILPTDTAYAVAVDAENEVAVRKVFNFKGRDYKKPLSIIVSDIKMAENYATISPQAKKVMTKFLPGALTLVLLKKESTLALLSSGTEKIGIRIPKCQLNLRLAQFLGRAYTATSANLSGEGNIYNTEDLLNSLSKEKVELIDLVVDAGRLAGKPSSTVVDFTISPPKLLREGPIRIEEIQDFVS